MAMAFPRKLIQRARNVDVSGRGARHGCLTGKHSDSLGKTKQQDRGLSRRRMLRYASAGVLSATIGGLLPTGTFASLGIATNFKHGTKNGGWSDMMPEIRRICDIVEITQVVNRIGPCGDQKLWEEERGLFTDAITIDFGPVKPPEIISVDSYIDWAEKAFTGVTSHHMLSNVAVLVDCESANVSAQGLTRHYRESNGDFWNIYQRYEFGLIHTSTGWKVNRLKMEPIFEEGNAKILETGS